MTKTATIYHNPRCSKSRQTLQLLQDQGCEVQVVEYLKQGLAEGEVRDLAMVRGCTLHALLRSKEAAYKAHGLSDESSDQDILAALLAEPGLLERPIVITDQGAALGRPPENVLTILA